VGGDLPGNYKNNQKAALGFCSDAHKINKLYAGYPSNAKSFGG
jgi:hypothetical protein